MTKERLDVLLVDKGICKSRDEAKRIIMAGKIKVNNEVISKAGTKIDVLSDIYCQEEKIPFVSRGGLKLQKALQIFSIDLQGKVAYDIGSSTGGFTDCMLQSGAKQVFAFDVGYGQLDWKLRNDSRVEVYEKTNFRHIRKEDIKEFKEPQFASIDVSFISLKLIFPALLSLAGENLEIVALVKPQFEAGREFVGKNGIIRDPDVHILVLTNILQFASSLGLLCRNLSFSPVKGAKGNIEYLAYLVKSEQQSDIYDLIQATVKQAHSEL